MQALLLAVLAPLQDPVQVEPLLLEGLPLPGIGAVTRIDNLAVNDRGEAAVEADTDHADTDADSVLIRDGVIYLREGQALPEPAGALLDGFDALTYDEAGQSVWNLFLDGVPSGEDSGVYLDQTLLLQEGDESAAAGFSAGTVYRGFFECKLGAPGDVVVMASVDDPAIDSSVDRALMLLDVSGGVPVGEVVLAKEGDVLPGQVEALEDFETGPHSFAASDAGVMFVAELAGSSATDAAVYVNAAVVAQEGSVEPNTGRSWDLLSLAEVDLSHAGRWVLTGSLDGDTASDSVIVTDSGLLAQEGSTLPAIAPFALERFGTASDTGPVFIDDDGDVLWYGDWDDPDTDRDSGLFLGEQLIVQEGVTAVAGSVIDTLRGVQDGYTMSDDGRFILFEAVLENGLEGAFYVSPAGAVTAMSDCFTPLGELSFSGGTVAVGGNFTLTMDVGQMPGALATILFSVDPIAGWPPCGLPLPGIGELLVDVLPPNPVELLAQPWLGLPVDFAVPVPNKIGLAGLRLYTQGIFAGFPSEPFRLTGGLDVVLGAP